MLKLATIGLISLLSFVAVAEPEIKGSPAELAQYLRTVPKTTLLTGEAELRVPAQRAVVTLKVVTENKSLQDALRFNLEFRTRLAEQLKKQGIPAERIQASKFSSTPKFGMFGEKAKSYRVENLVRVTVQDEKEFHAAAAAVDAWSEVQFVGVEFEYADKTALKEKTLLLACDNAIQRKKVYEEKFGVQLTAVSFSQGEVKSLNAAANYGAYSNRAYGLSSGVPADSAPAEAAVDESVSSLGELLYSARVTVEYSVQPK
jgi:uncharacterized protein YggE